MSLAQLTTADTPAAIARPLTWHYWPAQCSARAESARARLKGFDGPPDALDGRSLAVFGLGAVGGEAFQQAARLGVGSLCGADPDSYDDDSWLTQPADHGHAGCDKAWVQGGLASAINPRVNVETLRGFAQDMPLAVLRRADVFLAAGDNLEVLVWAGGLAAALGKPLVQGAVHGETWSAIVRAFDLTDPEAACPACTLSDSEWRNLRARQGCDIRTDRLQGREPTRTLPNICCAAAQLAVGESLKWLLGRQQAALRGEELTHCLLTYKTWRTTLPRNPDCRYPHRRWNLVDLPQTVQDATLGTLAELGTRQDGLVETLLQVRGEKPWISFALCGCGEQVPVRRFAKLGSKVGRCRCGQMLAAGPAGMRSTIPTADLHACWEQKLAELNVRDGEAVGMSVNDDWTYFFFEESLNHE